MTGFGRGEAELAGRQLVVEIKSVNHRYFDIRIRLPEGWLRIEETMRKRIQRDIKRGRLEVSVRWGIYKTQEAVPMVNRELAMSYVYCYAELRKLLLESKQDLNVYDQNQDLPISAVELLKLPGVIVYTDPEICDEQIDAAAFEALEQALQALGELRTKEGISLHEDLLRHVESCENYIAQLTKLSAETATEQLQRLKQRLSQLMQYPEIAEDRLHQEIAIIADRSDVSEELVRLSSHFDQFRATLAQGINCGRTLDFICQEMHREATTIGSKNQNIEIGQLLLSLKSTIEKIREQSQNIE